MAHSLSAYTTNDRFDLDLNASLTEARTPSTDASTPVSSYTSSPVLSPTTQSDEPHIPRPSNAFIIFRSEFLAFHKESLSKGQQKASKLAGAAWRELSKERQAHYKKLAKIRKEDHERAHPGYKYKPRRSERGKKAGGCKKKVDVPQAQISMGAQSFYHPPPISIATASGVPQPLDLILTSVDLSNQPFITTGNEISFATNQAMYPAQSFYHPSPPAASPFVPPGVSHIEAFNTSLDTTIMMNENKGLHEFFMISYNPTVRDKSTLQKQVYSCLLIAFLPRYGSLPPWGKSARRLGICVKCIEPGFGHLPKYCIPCCWRSRGLYPAPPSMA
ncbi:hypothetical protein DFS33DRAFT_187262 [Desarmillaria ectypa]|nr:hypothetical protein DFS33DRAFT_187262 [Desarmillaria ectypa]